MAVRSDVTVDFTVNPRIVTVLAPSTTITVQDLHDTLATIESELWNLKYKRLLSSGGKENLGGGEFVGVTTTMLDTQLSFQARSGILSSGTITTANSEGTSLIDSGATFISDGVRRGSYVQNITDNSIASVLEVVSETELTLQALSGGTDNDFDLSDSYQVFGNVQCTVTGGNIVSVDDMNNEISAIFETFGVQVSSRASTSAALLSADSDQLGRIEKILRNEMRTDPTTGILTILDDDNLTPFLSAPLWENLAKTIPYRGRGAEVRERLT